MLDREIARIAGKKMQMIAPRHGLVRDRCASRAPTRTRPCRMPALSLEITLSVPYCRPWRMGRLRQCCAVLQVRHLQWEAACAPSGIMGMEGAVVEVALAEATVVGLLLFLSVIGNEARDCQREALEVEVAGVGPHTSRDGCGSDEVL